MLDFSETTPMRARASTTIVEREELGEVTQRRDRCCRPDRGGDRDRDVVTCTNQTPTLGDHHHDFATRMFDEVIDGATALRRVRGATSP